MRNVLSILLLFSFFAGSAQSQYALRLTNPERKEVVTFSEGAYLVFKIRSSGEVREGRITAIDDSSLTFDDGRVELSEIKVLAGTSKGNRTVGRIVNVLGTAFIIAGSAVFHCGWDIMLHSEYYYWPIGGSVWLAGAVVAGIGYVFDAATYPIDQVVKVRNYRGWNAEIVEINRGMTNSGKHTSPPDDEKPQQKKTYDDDVYGD